MSITIGGYEFNGPYPELDQIEARSGVYAILCKQRNGEYSVLDIGESSAVYDRLIDHDREDCWKKQCSAIYYAVFYTPNGRKPTRTELEKALRQQYAPPCGQR